jgi:hypothetical protein
VSCGCGLVMIEVKDEPYFIESNLGQYLQIFFAIDKNRHLLVDWLLLFRN